ncbi:hypothetical protein [Angelakisella massiliensis]|uniref:hypothetical protein n=1 Tax=Angelakisella massiliensis TaxID=1871018 RepID=UPI0008F96437|nr:hypothetical protein [Angelakisella massiliensis]
MRNFGWLVSFAVLALIWTVYYLAMHITGGILTKVDMAVCGAVLLFCAAVILGHIYCFWKRRK